MQLFQVYKYKTMVSFLVYRDLYGRYKGSILGFLWTFLNPLLQLVVYSIVFSIILRMGIENYSLFLFVALIPWIFFAQSIQAGSLSIINNTNLVTKIYFPREVLPISIVHSGFINMLYSFIIVLLAVIIYGSDNNYLYWLYLPLLFAIEYITVLGIAFIVSSVTVYFRDLSHILGVFLMVWQFLTPVLYPISMVPEKYQYLFELNPMTNIITSYREILFYNNPIDLWLLMKSLLYAVLLLFIGSLIFKKLSKGFAENL